jgi:hypothetical protein
MSRIAALFGALALAALTAGPVRADASVAILPLGFAVEEFRSPHSYFARTLPSSQLLAEKLPLDRPLIAVWSKERGAALHLEKGVLKTTPFQAAGEEGPLRETPRNGVPGTRMLTAGALTTFFSSPRADYRHGIFGGIDDSGALTIAEKQPLAGVSTQARAVPTTTSTVEAGPEAVFEDLEPRLADLDGDGVPETVVVKSYLATGSALAVIGKRDSAWTVVAETPPIGERHRWLAPAAIADFDADGQPEIALVRTPHLQGVLQVWGLADGRLALKHEAVGYTNHVLGSTVLDNAAAVDLDGDGLPELVIPAVDRKVLAVLSLKGGIKEIRRIPLPAAAGKGLAALGSGKDVHIVAVLEDGRVAAVRP